MFRCKTMLLPITAGNFTAPDTMDAQHATTKEHEKINARPRHRMTGSFKRQEGRKMVEYMARSNLVQPPTEHLCL
jgi:hypothetical protein